MKNFICIFNFSLFFSSDSSATADVIDCWNQAMTPEVPTKVSICLDYWLNMWGKLCYGSAGLSDFPIWVQLLPKIYFTLVCSKYYRHS